ncbi:MAG: 4a-hydroxytetrahydrobiopterin dehydratase [Thermoproteus sp.]
MRREEYIVYRIRFKSYTDAARFLASLAEAADRLGHHPDAELRYVDLVLKLTTHDAGNRVAERDLSLAREIERLLEAYRESIVGVE